MKAINAVGAVVYRVRDDGKLDILLIRKQKGQWSLPKGKIEAGEDEDAAVLREVYEETGIVGEVVDLIGHADYRISKRAGQRRKTVTYYLLYAAGGSLRPDSSEKIVRVRWVPIDRAQRRLKRTRLRSLVRAAQIMLVPRRRR